MPDLLVFDIECYRNYFLIQFMNMVTGNLKYFELHNDSKLDIALIKKIIAAHTCVGFNIRNYDNPMLSYALAGATNDQLKNASDAIIQGNIKPWVFETQFGVKLVKFDFIDIFDVAPGIASLKIYGGRLHSRKMQDLPLEPGALVSPEERPAIRNYCANDLGTTKELFNYLKPQIELRERMSKDYREDLRSKSDAQIAEAVIVSQAKRMFNKEVYKPGSTPGSGFKYRAPGFINFKTPQLQQTLEMIHNTTFIVDKNGYVQMPDALGDYEIRIGNGVYRMGMGGLHSSEKSVCHVADDKTIIMDHDVTGYYPQIILNCQLYPKHFGPEFLLIYKDIVKRRLDAKKSGDKVTADSLKITVNGSFGKLGSKWSKLYSPDLMIQVTMTGQLAILMLIEMMHAEGIEVLSANTDGITTKCSEEKRQKMNQVVRLWCWLTSFEMEDVEYSAFYSRDVNNYIAIKKDGGHKTKGAFAPPGLQKNPQNEICTEAVVDFLEKRIDWEKSILECKDIRKFVTIRQVKGGGVKRWSDETEYLGKAVRWYYSHNAKGVIEYKVNGNTVARSEGAIPLMELPDELPDDINYRWYLDEARSILQDIGYYGQWV